MTLPQALCAILSASLLAFWLGYRLGISRRKPTERLWQLIDLSEQTLASLGAPDPLKAEAERLLKWIDNRQAMTFSDDPIHNRFLYIQNLYRQATTPEDYAVVVAEIKTMVRRGEV